jgi:hypothetical protein
VVENRVSNAYEHALQSCYWDISNLGICTSPAKLQEGVAIADAEITRNLAICSNQWACPVFVGRLNIPDPDEPEDEDEEEDEADYVGPSGAAVNINSTKGQFALLKKLKELGYDVPKITGKDSDGQYVSKESAGELAIQKMLSDNQFGYPGGDPALRAVLKVRELGKLKSSYFNARLCKRGDAYYFLSAYNVAGTLSGRRSSKRHTFNFGNNGQNFPNTLPSPNFSEKP